MTPRFAPFAASLFISLSGCASSSSSPARTQPPPQQYPQQGYAPGYGPPPQQYPPQQYPQQQYPQQQYPQQAQQPATAPAPAATTPFGLPPFQFPFPTGTASTGTTGVAGLQAPLIGQEAQKAEVASILQELIANLQPDKQARVRGIPLVFDPNPNEINAFAGCDDRGGAFMAGTVGILDAIDAIAQTKATDGMFGTQTYEAYMKAVLPRLQATNGGSAALPQGIISPIQLVDPRRLSRARDLFDEITAFVFGHELAHHYEGHTGCANGQGVSSGVDSGTVARLGSRIAPIFNQPLEAVADNDGVFNVLTSGKNRRPKLRWTEEGALMLLDFFSRLEGVPLLHPVNLLSTHPNSKARAIAVQLAARVWAVQNPG